LLICTTLSAGVPNLSHCIIDTQQFTHLSCPC